MLPTHNVCLRNYHKEVHKEGDMPLPSQPEKKDKSKNIGPDDSFYQRPNFVLLDEEQWSYIQRHFHMSPRELQVAKLVCEGFSNGEIAKNLRIKQGTAKTHLRNIYRRIRVKNKISMLLKIVDQASKFSTKIGITPPAPIVDIKKPAQKPSVPVEICKKQK
jgi:DNA-binding CsgD family transcriptional regulator